MREPDIRPLLEPVSAEAMQEAYAHAPESTLGETLRGPRARRIVPLAIIGLIAVLVLGGLVSQLVEGALGQRAQGVVVFLILAALITVGWLSWLQLQHARRERYARLASFARANGFDYEPTRPGRRHEGVVFHVGSSRRDEDVFHFLPDEPGQREVEVGTHVYEEKSSSRRDATEHRWGYLAVRLDRRLPHLLLDATRNDGAFGVSNLPIGFAKDQRLSLEGDFDRHFALYCPREYETDALYVFTPDVMGLLIDETGAYDVEVVDDWLYVYSVTPFALLEPETWRRLHRIRTVVGERLARRSTRYADDRATAPIETQVTDARGPALDPGEPPPAASALTSRLAHDRIAPGGARLRRRRVLTTSTVGVAAGAIGLYWLFGMFDRLVG
ncbi:hypothetical protein ARHIZOSPH14_01040 [Agromyces rhizosphaerae]|uniref:DUF3137 domain-containing protein n=1 Tax=Agromyces rhizosphaerae TaxID=88374 RepID=A0A9W6FPS7_9MICO|nr:hypothetical protein [Agromyces rhizosphaerae]GLI25862.1 hypothetical protein ARHIZOSPH14_01040 [Agromyces rhizosphaerae]